MAKIDIGSIENYENMTAEEKLEALQGYEFPDPDYKGYIKKETFDKTASELAGWKKKHNALLTEEQQKQTQTEDMISEMKSELEALRSAKQLSELKTSFLALGYDETLAGEISQHTVDGNSEQVFACQQKFLKAYKSKIEKELANNVPDPHSGSKSSAITKETLNKMTPNERLDFYNSNKEVYTEIYKE